MPDSSDSKNTVKKLLAANRSEIATRIFRGARGRKGCFE